jgi:hypothetical protein
MSFYDPFRVMIHVAEELYWKTNADISFDQLPPGMRNYCGVTDMGEKRPFVLLNPRRSVITSLDTLAHELAHIIDKSWKQRAIHSSEWRCIYKAIINKYNSVIKTESLKIIK